MEEKSEMSEEKDPLVDVEKGKDFSEEELLKRSLDFSNLKLSDKPHWDLKRKLILAKILPLWDSGKTYDEIHEILGIARCQVYEILKLYFKQADHNDLVDLYWWQLFHTLVKSKPEAAFNALTQIKLKRMMQAQPTQAGEITIKWGGKDEQNTRDNHSVSASLGSEVDARLSCTVQNEPLRTQMGENDVGSQRRDQGKHEQSP